MSNTIAMIFAAGLGTRFKPWTDSHPKALAPVNGKSLLQKNIEYLQSFGIRDVVVNVHHFPDQIIDTLFENKGWGSSIQISDEREEVLETGGGLMKAKPFFEGFDQIVTLNADILTGLDLNAMLNYHLQSAEPVTVAVMKRQSSRYLLFSEEMKLGGWRHVATGEEIIRVADRPLQELAFSGITVFDAGLLDSINKKGKFSLLDIFLDLSEVGSVRGFDHSGDLFIDVGKPGTREEAEKYFQ